MHSVSESVSDSSRNLVEMAPSCTEPAASHLRESATPRPPLGHKLKHALSRLSHRSAVTCQPAQPVATDFLAIGTFVEKRRHWLHRNHQSFWERHGQYGSMNAISDFRRHGLDFRAFSYFFQRSIVPPPCLSHTQARARGGYKEETEKRDKRARKEEEKK